MMMENCFPSPLPKATILWKAFVKHSVVFFRNGNNGSVNDSPQFFLKEFICLFGVRVTEGEGEIMREIFYLLAHSPDSHKIARTKAGTLSSIRVSLSGICVLALEPSAAFPGH